jgi:hypothetical protein
MVAWSAGTTLKCDWNGSVMRCPKPVDHEVNFMINGFSGN